MNNHKGVIFDLDQTLANTEDFVISSNTGSENSENFAEWHLYEFLKPHLRIISWNEFCETYLEAKSQIKKLLQGTAASHNRYLYVQRTLEILGVRFTPQLIYNATEIYWNHILSKMALFPNVKKTLKKLKQFHVVTAVLTDLTADIQVQKLAKLKIQNCIDLLVTSEEAGADKPDVLPFKLALDKMGLVQEDVVMIGNNPKTDIAGAKNAGIRPILYDYYNKYPKFKGEKISDFSKTLDVLKISTLDYSPKPLVIFDLIGTLTTEPHLVRKTLSQVLAKNNIKVEYQKVKTLYEKLKVGAITDEDFWLGVGARPEEQGSLEDRLIDQIQLRQESMQAISDVSRNCYTAILSNIPSRWGERITMKYDLRNHVDETVFSGDHKKKKPDPELFKIVLSKFPNVNPSKTYIIDNELGDLRAAKYHIMNTIWLDIEKKDSLFVPTPCNVYQTSGNYKSNSC